MDVYILVFILCLYKIKSKKVTSSFNYLSLYSPRIKLYFDGVATDYLYSNRMSFVCASISITAEWICFSFTGKLFIARKMVLGYFSIIKAMHTKKRQNRQTDSHQNFRKY